MTDQFLRTEMLLGSAAMEKLRAARVAVFGLGGVGGYAVEALARSGIGALDIIDSDTLSITNINRQIYAAMDTIGMYKTDVAAARIARINPKAIVRAYKLFYSPETAGMFDFRQYDYIIDAIDTVTAKIELVMNANAAGAPIICSMGAGNKLDPTRFEVADLFKTSVCPLARVMRRELRQRGISKLKVVYSKEQPLTPDSSTASCDESGSRRQLPGSTAFVPSVAGLIIAGEVIKDIAEIR